jgi:hypothetical protein
MNWVVIGRAYKLLHTTPMKTVAKGFPTDPLAGLSPYLFMPPPEVKV